MIRTEKNNQEINLEELVDIRDIEIKTGLSIKEKKIDYIKQIKNPYLFRCGNLIIQVEHKNTGKTLEDCLKEYFSKRSL